MDALNKPKAGGRDVAYTLAKVGLSAIPIFGGPATEILSAVITPPLARRRDAWLESIARCLKELEEKFDGFTIESLAQNEEFITTFIQASQIAIRNHKEEKLEALRNAVLNSALPTAPEEDLQTMFLSLIDVMTPRHLKILEVIKNPQKWFWDNHVNPNIYVSGNVQYFADPQIFDSYINEILPDYESKYEIYHLLAQDLANKGLIKINPFEQKPIGTGILNCLTNMGATFIKFIISPLK